MDISLPDSLKIDIMLIFPEQITPLMASTLKPYAHVVDGIKTGKMRNRFSKKATVKRKV